MRSYGSHNPALHYTYTDKAGWYIAWLLFSIVMLTLCTLVATCKQLQYMLSHNVYTTGDLNAYGWLCRLLGELLLRPCCAEGFTGE